MGLTQHDVDLDHYPVGTVEEVIQFFHSFVFGHTRAHGQVYNLVDMDQSLSSSGPN